MFGRIQNTGVVQGSESGHADYDEAKNRGDHGSVISQGMPDIFAFFEAHSKIGR